MPESMEQKGKSAPRRYEDVITTHANADFDALASMIAARKLYPAAALVFPGSQEKNLRDFFLHSTSYLFNFVKLKQIDLTHLRRLILVDTRQRDRIGRFAELLDRPNLEIHVYDHHPDTENDIRGQVEVIEPKGSTTAILTRIIRERQLAVTPEEATVMCLGIHEDTGSFTFASTTPDDYRAAAWLTEQGADHNLIADMLTREMSAEEIWLLNDLTQAAVTRVINGVEIVFSSVIRDDYMGNFAYLVHKFMEMGNIQVVFALAQMQDRVHLVARSRSDQVNVAEIAMALGGGGHPQAASASIKNKTLTQVERSIQALLRSRVHPTKTARDMMSSPVIPIGPRDTLQEAADLMTRYNINVLLVLTEQGDLMGYITRQVVEKAIFFGLNDVQAQDYMNLEFFTIRPDGSLKEVQELIVRNKLRVLPVVEDGKVLGVITRTDLLTILLGEPVVPEFLYDAKHASQYTRKKNMAAFLKERLPRKVLAMLKDIGHVADMLGYKAYLVGGIVRDVFLKRENLDVDIVVEGNGIHFATEFARYHAVRVRSHKKFGTAVLVFPDGFKIDVATARMEYYEAPGSLPVVESSSLRMDLFRRDFSINSLALKLNPREYGLVIDYFGGQKDLKEKVLRVLHNLSFVEDPTRILRAVRFEQRFGFHIGKLTLALIKNAVKINVFKDVTGRRFWLELKLILREKEPISAIKRLDEFDLLPFVSPALKLSGDVLSMLEECRKVIDWYHLLYREERFDPWKVYFHGLTSDLEPVHLQALASNMGMVHQEEQRLIAQRGRVPELLEELYRFFGTNYQLHTLLLPFDTETLLYAMAKAGNDKTRRLISLYFTRLKDTRVEMTGRDLIRLGFKPGPLFRQVFDALLEARMNEVVKTREEEVQLVREHFNPREN